MGGERSARQTLARDCEPGLDDDLGLLSFEYPRSVGHEKATVRRYHMMTAAASHGSVDPHHRGPRICWLTLSVTLILGGFSLRPERQSFFAATQVKWTLFFTLVRTHEGEEWAQEAYVFRTLECLPLPSTA